MRLGDLEVRREGRCNVAFRFAGKYTVLNNREVRKLRGYLASIPIVRIQKKKKLGKRKVRGK